MATSDKKATDAKPDAQPQAQSAAELGLKVTARPPSFRRGGYTFTGEAKTIPLRDLSPEQVSAIENDPNLVCHRVAITPPEKAPEAAPEAA